MKTIGLIGGVTWQSTLDYYRYLNELSVQQSGNDRQNARIILDSLNFDRIAGFQEAGAWSAVADELKASAKQLEQAGADIILICANTLHIVYDEVASATSARVLHIGDATGEAMKGQGITRAGLIGTIYTMSGDFLTNWIRERHNIDVIVPDQSAWDRLNTIIYKELVKREVKRESVEYVINELDKMKAVGIQGAILGCTEFPILLRDVSYSLPFFDTTFLHAQYAVDYALGTD